MRKIVAYFSVLVSMALLSSCAAAWQNVSYSDDLYAIHNKIAIAERQKAEAELAEARYAAQQAQYEATMARIKAEAAQQNVAIAEEGTYDFNSVLADSYESAYARRLYGFSSPTYRMPSSYYTLRYSDAFFYASAYDPAFYNVMVSGDMVWVEPKYVTSMFGTWGATIIPTYGWYYRWNDPFYYWNRPYYYSWSCNYWNYPYHWRCGYPYGYYYRYHHHHYPHRPSYHRPPYHHPPYAGSGSVGSTGVHHNRPGMVVGRNPGASTPADRGGNSYRPSRPSSGRGTQPVYRGGSSSGGSSSGGSSSYRGGSNSGSSSYRGGSSSGSSYRSGSSSYSGGSSRSGYSGGGSYSGGGNSRGR